MPRFSISTISAGELASLELVVFRTVFGLTTTVEGFDSPLFSRYEPDGVCLLFGPVNTKSRSFVVVHLDGNSHQKKSCRTGDKIKTLETMAPWKWGEYITCGQDWWLASDYNHLRRSWGELAIPDGVDSTDFTRLFVTKVALALATTPTGVKDFWQFVGCPADVGDLFLVHLTPREQ